MARLQLIFPLLFWVVWASSGDLCHAFTPAWGTAVYFLLLAGVVGLVGLWSRRVMRRTTINVTAAIPRFHQGVFIARWALLGLHLVALFTLGFGDAVLSVVPSFAMRLDSVAAFASMLPVVVAWIGLLWMQYPLDRAIREQNALYAFEFGEPVHPVPTLWQYVATNTRQQILFTLAPLLVVALVRDALHTLADLLHLGASEQVDLLISLLSVAAVFVISPEILRRVLPTEALPASALRSKLEHICRDLGLRYRQILLWHTHHTLGNAAVMGVIPQVRYVLLSDRLIETMSEQQIEAVFAHEAGHVMHRHLAWYGVFFVVFMFACSGGAMLADRAVVTLGIPADVFNWSLPLAAVAGIFIAFGALSRAFERQADVFAVRCLGDHAAIDAPIRPENVAVFTSALLHVARLNNMPLDATALMHGGGWVRRLWAMALHHAGTWLHGSIRSRVEYLQQLPGKPERSARFDQRMYAIRMALLVALCSCTAWALTSIR
ncbi:MAG: M48 family metallopeptidase [Tepidisphaeraceae bacterium]